VRVGSGALVSSSGSWRVAKHCASPHLEVDDLQRLADQPDLLFKLIAVPK